jgi:hypothetical protein
MPNLKNYFILLIIGITVGLMAVPMSGNYTIGGASPDFVSINDAVDALVTNGVNGNTSFLIRAGNYNEQVIIPQISGTSNNSIISFSSETGDADDVIISHSATSSADNYIIRLDGANYFDFHYLTFRAEGTTNYGDILDLTNGTYNIRIRFNKFYSLGYNQVYSHIINAQLSGAQTIQNIEIQSNYFQDSYYGIYLYGVNATNYYNISVSNNLLYNQMNAIDLSYVPSVDIHNNRITDCNNAIKLSNSQSANIFKNNINAHASGIYIYYSSGANVYNNSIIVDGNVWSGDYGLAKGLTFDNSENSETYYNSIMIGESVENNKSYAFSLLGQDSHTVKNNIFANFGLGNSVYLNSVDSGDMWMDYNNLFSGRGILIKNGYYNSTFYYTLAQFQSGFGENANSVSVYPGFYSEDPLLSHSPWVDGKGTHIATISEDINGNPRDSSTPDIGCNEFTADPSNTTPMSGYYSVGSGYDYENLSAALNDLYIKGANGGVYLNLNDGNYSGNYKLYNIPSSSGSNYVSISLATGDPDLVYAATSENDNYLFRLMGGTTFYDFQYLTLETQGTDYTRIFDVSGYNRFRILGGSISAPFTTDNDHNKDLIYVKNAKIVNSDINTTFNNGSTAIYIFGDYNNLSTNIKIWNCDFNNNVSGINLMYIDSPEISGNTFNENYTPLQANSCNGNFRIIGNKIVKSGKNGNAVTIYNSTGGETQEERGLIANNTIKMTDCGNNPALVTNISNFDIVYNSIWVKSNGNSVHIASDNGTNLYKNNIFAAVGTGKAFDTGGNSFTSILDYNDFYCEGAYLIKLGGITYSNLDEYHTMLGITTNNFSAFPYFTEDMHTQSPVLYGKGTSISSIIDTDIDGQYRAEPICIGADSFGFIAGTDPLNGNYTIGTSRADFSSFTEAAHALSYRGISGNVTFLVESGIYTEQAEFKQIYGADSSNSVIIKSATETDSDVVWQFGPTETDSNYIVFINGADYITFKDLTIRSTMQNNYYNRLFLFQGDADHIQINSNTLHNDSDSNYGDGNGIFYGQYNSFTSRIIYENTIENGKHGYSQYYYYNGDTSGLQIGNNNFIGTKYPISCSSNSIRIYNNTMTDFTTAIQISNTEGQTIINDNTMVTQGFYDYYHGYNLFSISSSDGTENQPILIYNNTIKASDNMITSLSGYSIYDCKYVDFYHNNSVVENEYDVFVYATRGSALSIQSSDHIKVKNNILAYKGNGLAYELQSGGYTNYELDYNDLYNEGMFLVKIAQNKYKTIQEVRDNSSYDDHSVKAPPLLDSNCYTTSKFLNGKGTAIAAVTTDIEGNPRDASTPDIGCNEFTPTSSWEPMTGNYTIGANRADYTSITEAINDVVSRGKGEAPLTFNIENGIYNEQLDFLFIPRVESSSGYVTFQSASEDANNVIIQHEANDSDDNYLLKIVGSKYLVFNGIKFVPQNTSYNRIALIKGYNQHLAVSNSIFEGVDGANYNNGAIVYFEGATFQNIWFANNEFNNGGYSVFYNNNGYPEYANVLLFSNNSFDNNYKPMYLHSISDLYIESNNFTNQDNIVLDLENIHQSLSIYKNNVTTSGSKCLAFDIYNGEEGTIHRIANNFFNLNTDTVSSRNANTFANCDYLDIYLNTFRSNDFSANGKVFSLVNGNSNINIRDNIFANMATGYAVDIQDINAILTMDHNLFYTGDTNFIIWDGTNYSDLTNLQADSGFNANSIVGNPIFVDATTPNIDSSSPAINAGIIISNITDDINGTIRDENYDIGAFEFVGGITPSVPQNVTIQIINNTTARISWEASSNATQYIVEFSDLPDGTFTQAAVTTNTTVDIPIISTKKFYRVIATN